MEENDEIENILPPDDELVRREKLFLNLFEKFSVDEGSDPEIIDDNDSDNSTVQDSDNGSELSYSESSDNETEDYIDVEKMDQKLLPVITDRVNAWPDKGIHLQLRTVDPSVSVDDWLSSHSHECTTTTKKYKKTVVNDKTRTTITTRRTTTTTTTRKSFTLLRRGQSKDDRTEEVKAITNGEETASVEGGALSVSTRDEDAFKKHKSSKSDKSAKKFQKNKHASDLISKHNIPNINSTKTFPRSSKPQKVKKIESIARIVRPDKTEPPEEVKKLSPKRTIKRKENRPEPTAVTSGAVDSCTESLGNQLEHQDIDISTNASGQSEPERTKSKSTSSSSIIEPSETVFHSPGAGDILDTNIDIRNINSTKIFPRSSKLQKEKKIQSIASIVLPDETEPPEKVKKLSPKRRIKRKENRPEPTAVNSGAIDSRTESLGNELVHEDIDVSTNASGQSEPERTKSKSTSSSSIIKPSETVFHSPGAGDILDTKIDIRNINSTKIFPRSSKLQKEKKIQSIASIVLPVETEPPEKVKKLSPKGRIKRKENRPEPTAVTSGAMNSCTESLGNQLEHQDIDISTNASGQSEPERTKPTSSFSMTKPAKIVLHSPGAGDILGTKIDEEFMRVTKKDYEKRIDCKHLQITAKSFIVPINQRIVYEPPMAEDEEKEYDSESDDELLTSYTRKGHIMRIE